MSAFIEFRNEAYPFKFSGTLLVDCLVGGTPSDPKVAEGWLRTKMNVSTEKILNDLVGQIMLERGLSAEEALKAANEYKNLNGFKRDPEKGLYIEGRQLKAALKEAVSVAVAAGKISGKGWGKTNKGLLGFIAEHVFVVEERLYLGVVEPTGIHQRFVHTWKGTGIQYEEYVENAKIDFRVIADYDFSSREWAAIWLTGEQQGIGATRSMGYGRYVVESWERLDNRSKAAKDAVTTSV